MSDEIAEILRRFRIEALIRETRINSSIKTIGAIQDGFRSSSVSPRPGMAVAILASVVMRLESIREDDTSHIVDLQNIIEEEEISNAEEE